jgi:hypothetical protein
MCHSSTYCLLEYSNDTTTKLSSSSVLSPAHSTATFVPNHLATLHGVLRLTQRRHDINAVGLSSEFLDSRIL